MSVEEWWVTKRLNVVKSSTAMFYQSLIRHIIREIGDVKMRNVDAALMRQLFNDTSPGRHKHVEILVRQWLPKGHKALDGIVRTHRPAKRMECPSLDEAARLAESARWGGPMLLTAAMSGLRFGELCALSVKDVDLDRKRIWVDKTWNYHTFELTSPKSRASVRETRFHDDLVPVLWFAMEGKDMTDEVFTAPTGGRINYSNYRTRCWLPAVKGAGLEQYTFHDLRHCYATMLINRNVPPALVSKMLGHASTGMTLDIYTGWWPGEQAALDAALQSESVER